MKESNRPLRKEDMGHKNKAFCMGRGKGLAAVLCGCAVILLLCGCAKTEQPVEIAAAAAVQATPDQSITPAEAEAVEVDGETIYVIEAPAPTPTPVPTPTPSPTPIPVEDCKDEKGYISGNGINLRIGPGTDFEVVQEFSRGTALTITGIAEEWYEVKIDEQTGFISAEFVGKGEVPLSFTVQKLKRQNGAVTAANVNMREEPSTKGKQMEKLELFTHVTITGETEDWYQVEYQGETGYITKKYLEPAQGYYDAEELYLVAQIVNQECRSSQEGQIAVANVIYNRLRSHRFPGSIERIVFQKGQFSPADNESRLRSVKASRGAIKAVLEIFVRGNTILPRDVLYFRAKRLGTQWSSSRSYYGTIGGNCFYK